MSVLDVAQYILNERGQMSRMTLQKLAFYSQAWFMVWNNENQLFDEDFEAWIDGPVCRELYDAHTSYDQRQLAGANAEQLTPAQRRTIDAVLEYYGRFNGNQLSDLTHMEQPWRDARGSLPANQRSQQTIPKPKIYKYYFAQQPGREQSAIPRAGMA